MIRRPHAALAALLLLVLLATGCGGLPGSGPAPSLYVLTPKNTFPHDLPQVEGQLVISLPTAGRALQSDRIALRPIPEEIKYFKGARWISNLPYMVQTLMLESFENTGKITSVGREAITLRPDYQLLTEIREFQADRFSSGPPTANVRLNLKLIHQPEQRIIAAKTFESRTKAEHNTMKSVIQAFDRALGDTLKDSVSWTLRRMGRNGSGEE
ncbi:ABC-type transport auxiliary lipoprotein family protein [Desulfohalovibrio reitneri]|uniref:ABC-type transport auxiliary lipoprotein family protein n=1 Tax=Desulfohalovibrio reitneri TaxID=1307759 RepID=UPI0004A6EC5D|nr:ABC-type transport auxiliary lipoprotein family protein [Desulfohalovibrio reitneri]